MTTRQLRGAIIVTGLMACEAGYSPPAADMEAHGWRVYWNGRLTNQTDAAYVSTVLDTVTAFAYERCAEMDRRRAFRELWHGEIQWHPETFMCGGYEVYGCQTDNVLRIGYRLPLTHSALVHEFTHLMARFCRDDPGWEHPDWWVKWHGEIETQVWRHLGERPND